MDKRLKQTVFAYLSSHQPLHQIHPAGTLFALNFPYVCLCVQSLSWEIVRFYYNIWLRKRGEKGAFFTNLAPGFFIRERNVNALHKPAETPPFPELSLHLSRACLGKTIALQKTPCNNQPKKGVLFSRTVCEQLRLDHRGGLSHQLRARGLCLLCPRRPTALETQS
jgi:hypothetical protein